MKVYGDVKSVGKQQIKNKRYKNMQNYILKECPMLVIFATKLLQTGLISAIISPRFTQNYFLVIFVRKQDLTGIHTECIRDNMIKTSWDKFMASFHLQGFDLTFSFGLVKIIFAFLISIPSCVCLWRGDVGGQT